MKNTISIFITMQGACGDMAIASTVREIMKKSCGVSAMKSWSRLIFCGTETPMELKVDAVKTAEYTVHQAYDIDVHEGSIGRKMKRNWLLLSQRMIRNFSGPVCDI